MEKVTVEYLKTSVARIKQPLEDGFQFSDIWEMGAIAMEVVGEAVNMTDEERQETVEAFILDLLKRPASGHSVKVHSAVRIAREHRAQHSAALYVFIVQRTYNPQP